MNEKLKKYEDNEEVIIIEEIKETHPVYGVAAKIAFFLFVFFIFYGTKGPFRERTFDVSEIGTSNLFNQVVFTTIFLLACFALIPRLKEAINFIYKEKMITIFILWCLLSLTWSDYSFVGFKRWFQLFTAFITILAIFQYVKTTDVLLKYFAIPLSLFVIINLITIFTIPLAKDDYGEWRGIATSKNFLGQAALACSLIFIYAIKRSENFFAKTWYIISFIIASILVFGCASSTSLLTYVIIGGIWLLYWIDNQFKKLELGKVLTLLTVFGVLTLSVVSVMLIPEKVNDALGLIGEDLTFTGRTDLWDDVMIEVKQHVLLGTGYQSFWVMTNPDLIRIYEQYIWLPTQSHNGYIDILNEVGVIGLLLLLATFVFFFYKKRHLKIDYFWKWFLVAAIIINFQESTLFRPGILSGIMFMFAYMGLFKELEYQKEYLAENEDREEQRELVEEESVENEEMVDEEEYLLLK